MIASRCRAQVQKESQVSTRGPPELVDEGYDMVFTGFHFIAHDATKQNEHCTHYELCDLKFVREQDGTEDGSEHVSCS